MLFMRYLLMVTSKLYAFEGYCTVLLRQTSFKYVLSHQHLLFKPLASYDLEVKITLNTPQILKR